VYLFKEKVIHGADVSEFSTKVLHPDGKTAARPERNGSRDHETAMRALVPGNACKLSTRQIRCKPNAYLRAAMSVISISDSAGSGRIPSPHSRHPIPVIGFRPFDPLGAPIAAISVSAGCCAISVLRMALRASTFTGTPIKRFMAELLPSSHPTIDVRRGRMTQAPTAGAGIARAPDTVI